MFGADVLRGCRPHRMAGRRPPDRQEGIGQGCRAPPTRHSRPWRHARRTSSSKTFRPPACPWSAPRQRRAHPASPPDPNQALEAPAILAQRARHARSKIRAGLHQQYRQRARPARRAATTHPAAPPPTTTTSKASLRRIADRFPWECIPPIARSDLPRPRRAGDRTRHRQRLACHGGYCSQMRSGHGDDATASGVIRQRLVSRARKRATRYGSSVRVLTNPGGRQLPARRAEARRRTPRSRTASVTLASDRLTGQG